MKKFFLILYGATIYFTVLFIDMFLYKVHLIPNFGFSEYSVPERIFFYILTFVYAVFVMMILKEQTFKGFIRNAIILWLTYLIFRKVINVQELVSILIKGYETYAYEPNYMSQDIWLFHEIGCFIGTVAGGLYTYLRGIKKTPLFTK